jgi:DNA-binding transcriptional MerR regulator
VSSTAPFRAYMSIGEVLAQLRTDFPDVTISKIRFLEQEGLVEPERTQSGYRKFGPRDVERLRYVLSAQRDQYLPLRVIKEHLAAIDRGLEPPSVPGGAPRVPRALVAAEGYPDGRAFATDPGEVRLSRAELLGAAGTDEGRMRDLEAYGMVARRAGSGHYDGDALLVAKTVGELAAYGLEPRHLRSFKTAADREIGLIEQVIVPLLRQRNPESRARAENVVREMAALSVRLHAALVKAGLAPRLLG